MFQANATRITKAIAACDRFIGEQSQRAPGSRHPKVENTLALAIGRREKLAAMLAAATREGGVA